MTLIVDSFSELLIRYSEFATYHAVSSTWVNSYGGNVSSNQADIINKAEAYVQGLLAPSFTPPFSNNNQTAKDLVIDAAFLQCFEPRRPKDAAGVRKSFDARIQALLNGQEMVDINGTVCHAPVGDVVWSNMMNYHPTFDMNSTEVQAVDSQELIDNNNARGFPSDLAL